jgi:ketosteroid isomerase-like protein
LLLHAAFAAKFKPRARRVAACRDAFIIPAEIRTATGRAKKMKRAWALAVAALFFAQNGCAAAVPAAGASEARLASVRSQLEATFAARMRAYEAEDLATLVGQIAPDYVAVRPDGSRMSRDDLAAYIRRNLERWVQITSWSNDIESLRMEGANAVVDMRQRVARIQIVDGREAEVESRVLQTETWTPTPEGWKLLSVRDERDMSVTIDGRPVG